MLLTDLPDDVLPMITIHLDFDPLMLLISSNKSFFGIRRMLMENTNTITWITKYEEKYGKNTFFATLFQSKYPCVSLGLTPQTRWPKDKDDYKIVMKNTVNLHLAKNNGIFNRKSLSIIDGYMKKFYEYKLSEFYYLEAKYSWRFIMGELNSIINTRNIINTHNIDLCVLYECLVHSINNKYDLTMSILDKEQLVNQCEMLSYKEFSAIFFNMCDILEIIHMNTLIQFYHFTKEKKIVYFLIKSEYILQNAQEIKNWKAILSQEEIKDLKTKVLWFANSMKFFLMNNLTFRSYIDAQTAINVRSRISINVNKIKSIFK